MSEQIKRWDGQRGATISASDDGEFVLYSDHLADKEASRAEDLAEIDRLRRDKAKLRKVVEHHLKVTERFHERAEKAEDCIAELEAQIRKLNKADSKVNDICGSFNTATVKDHSTVRSGSTVKDSLTVAEDEAVRRDAERYRWLRISANISWNGYIEYQNLVATDEERQEMDDAIDAAITAAKESK